jgi:hypothetical protein
VKHPAQLATNTRAAAFRRLAEWFARRSGEADCERDLKAAMEGEPCVTPKLKSTPGGLRAVLAALRAYADDDASAFIAMYDSRSILDLRYLTWEEIAVAADIGASRLFEISMSALRVMDDDAIKATLYTSGNKLTQHLMKRALTDKNIAALDLAMRVRGLSPIPKSSQVAIQINQSQQQDALPAPDATPTTWDQERTLRDLHEAGALGSGEMKKLPAAAGHDLPANVAQLQEQAVEVLDDVF